MNDKRKLKKFRGYLLFGIIVFSLFLVGSLYMFIRESIDFYNEYIDRQDKKGWMINIQEGINNER